MRPIKNCIFSSYQSISNSFCFLYFSCRCMHHKRAIWSFCKVNEGGSFHAKGNGQYGNRSQLIIIGLLHLQTWMQDRMQPVPAAQFWLWSTLMKAGVKSLSWMKGGAHQRDKNPQLPNWVDPLSWALQSRFRNNWIVDTGGCLPYQDSCWHIQKQIMGPNLKSSLFNFALRKMFSG